MLHLTADVVVSYMSRAKRLTYHHVTPHRCRVYSGCPQVFMYGFYYHFNNLRFRNSQQVIILRLKHAVICLLQVKVVETKVVEIIVRPPYEVCVASQAASGRWFITPYYIITIYCSILCTCDLYIRIVLYINRIIYYDM